MANDKTPSQSTYQTKTLALIKELNNRGTNTNQDEDYVNFFPELVKNRTTREDSFKLIKRSGSSVFITPAGEARGAHYWKDEQRLFLAVSDDVYVYNAVTGALITTINTVFPSTTSGKVGFCEFLYDTGEVKLVVTDGTTLSTIDSSNVAVAGADGDMPVHIPTPVFLDGYIFIIKINSADIYNSNLNNPLLWTPGDFITAEMRADQLTTLAILNNYILAFGNSSIEYFWDAAIATGSPLQRNDTPIKLTGFVSAAATHGNKLYFVGGEESSTPGVFVMEDFKIKPIGNEAIRRHLGSLTGTFTEDIRGSIISMGGHDFYVLDTGILTYVLEIETGLWMRWVFKQGTQFPVTFAANVLTNSLYHSLFIISNVVYKFVPTLYRDDGVNFTCTLVTDKIRFDTYRNKFMSRLVIWASRPNASSSITVSWTDDDYTTYSTAISVDLFSERPTLYRLGRFRERAFKFTYTDNYPLLLQGIEVDINMGQT